MTPIAQCEHDIRLNVWLPVRRNSTVASGTADHGSFGLSERTDNTGSLESAAAAEPDSAPTRRRQHLANIGSVATGRSEGRLEPKPKIVVVKLDAHRDSHSGTAAAVTDAVRLAAHTIRAIGITQLKIVLAR